MMNFHRNPSELLFYIERSCSSTLEEPNLAFNLEVVDFINQKKGNMAREAAMMIVRKVNNRSSLVPMLALSLLDVCMKNCGYPFHLQVATKEFLNKLVRQFPERPPCRLTRLQTKILQAIAEWNQTLCMTSRYKEDLINIRDMYRLLQFKGYMFPEIQHDSASVLNTPDNFRSPEELEQEDRETKSAKLQELVRRGTPADLVEANKLMKILAGYDTGMRNNYRAKVAEDIEKIRRKTFLLQEMLKTNNKDMLYKSDICEDFIASIKNAQPKIQKILEQEKNDTEAISKLLELNDMINVTILQYGKSGEENAFNEKSDSNSVLNNSVEKKDISLIDFDDQPNSHTNPVPVKDERSELDDLLGLSFDDNSSEFFNETNEKTPVNFKSLSLIDDSFDSTLNSKLFEPNISFNNTQNEASHNHTASQFMFNKIPGIVTNKQKNINISVLDTPDLVIHFLISRKNASSNSPILIEIGFSNKSFTDMISSLNFQISVPKTILLKTEQQNGSIINPTQRNGITQLVTIFGIKDELDHLKLKWKVSYYLGNSPMEKSGVIDQIPFI
ncbi:hypothetical protein T552_02272 [Pneumocystis carinii B80]|uniref:VHS domain-containing protein n=1 Tax=Pneumocystis carinii (strain B80) TaxID=1408658 RepID=A0A0W4ZFY9_PNEC8|nr:hypothetical protein T552_02272 [Pneumocystis carinii B80]KTW27289.1 hypothetical protein T552_02272 [Pneumocystis carinii B80]